MKFIKFCFGMLTAGALQVALAQDQTVVPDDLIGTWVESRYDKPLNATFATTLVIKTDWTFDKTETADAKVIHQYAGSWRLHKGQRLWRLEESCPDYAPNMDRKNAMDFEIQGKPTPKELLLMSRDTGRLVLYKRVN